MTLPRPGGSTRKRRQLRAALINRALMNGERCPLCHMPLLPNQRLAVDHIIAVCWGGTDDPRNLQVTHSKCNLKKGRGDAPVWVTSR
jgi:HNH endonuclease